ncbi:glycosyltransferase [Aurantimonas sp. C2-6-R+9]|uniref:glycosyltransferase n=1 Tax=unclassified Aurantimonas TaxID=2638230 RepID=UPI002E194C48|nr:MULTISPECIES: glycosyltransferase [unclassified Aurantimonas]MEC5291467.1 glycosyltransferase [Aurantimonas sp. C2-3-R2]MEC5381731.1 glycosyltransferase [Aurantimonas sp. C2-6-R+9]MEC5412554.1 glycosyltransferase [Aurantimonas sp. C2-4-R8]
MFRKTEIANSPDVASIFDPAGSGAPTPGATTNVVHRPSLFATNPTALDLRPLVAVPARDEAERLPGLIRALAKQSWLRRGVARLDVVLILNNCRDDSLGAALREAEKHAGIALHAVTVAFEPVDAHAGSARRLALDTARALCPSDGSGVLLTTDADAVPANNWIEANLAAISQGADLVGGRLIGNVDEEALLGPAFLRRARDQQEFAMLSDQLTAIVDPLPHDPWPRHHDHTGASLAVRADVYDRVGGLPALPRREDLALVTNVRSSGFKVRHAPEVIVEVSARLSGRAAGGMADCLKQWVTATQAGDPHLVEAPTTILERARRRRLLRTLGDCDAASLATAAMRLSILPADLHDSFGQLLSPEELVERFAPEAPDAIPTVPVRAAIDELQMLILNFGGASRAA